jgi:hypothetical protein
MTLPIRADLLPGDIGFARHVSPRSADLLITAGQLFLGEPRYPHHVFVVVESGDRPRIVQAMPSGAEEIETGPSFWNEGYLYVRPAYALGQGEEAAAAARRYVGRPYSFADYVALALHKVRDRGYVPIGERTWLERYVSSSGRMICSQLADQALTDAGWHTFTDGRLSQDVTPGALCRQLGKMPGRHVQPGLGWEINR